MNTTEMIFENWLSSCLNKRVGNYIELMAGEVDFSDVVDEQTQLKWFDEQNWQAIRNYRHSWKGQAATRLIAEAPNDVVSKFLFYCAPIDHEKQVTLALRDVKNQTHLAREYFGLYHACEDAQRIIKDYDVKLWHRMLMVNYGWEWKFEKKFGTLGIWQNKLRANYDKLTECNFEDIPAILDAIE